MKAKEMSSLYWFCQSVEYGGFAAASLQTRVSAPTLSRAVSQLEDRLGEITVPALVVQSIDDPVVDEKGSRRVFELLGSAEKRYILFNLDRHGILLGPGARWVHRTVGSFIDDLTKGLFITG